MTRELFLGLISGTSMDAADCALVDFAASPCQVVAFDSLPLPQTLKQQLLDLCSGRPQALQDLGEADTELARLFARAALDLLSDQGLSAADVTAIGSHGQTLYHQPPTPATSGRTPFTLQIGDPNTLCEHTGIITVADFRRRDLAAGGQGAPLAPAFHREIFQRDGHDRIVVNIGGMANITHVPGDPTLPTLAFDTGPGNVLMDDWARHHLDQPFDDAGRWAACGTCNEPLLAAMLAENYFHHPPPKSTGRELFNTAWLERHLAGNQAPPADIQATLLELTAATISDAITGLLDGGEVILCGGGAHNTRLTERLAARLPGFSIADSGHYGLDPDGVEAVAFAWLARKALRREPVDLTAITGASHPCLLGGIYNP